MLSPFNKTALGEGRNFPLFQEYLITGAALILGLLLGIWGFLYPNLLSLFIPAFLIFLAALLVKPDWGYLLAVASLPIINLQYILPIYSKGMPIAMYPLHALILPLWGGWFLWRCSRLAPPARFNGLEPPLIALGLFTALSILWAPDNNFSHWQIWLMFVNISIFLFAGFYIRDRKMLNQVFHILFLMGIITAFAALLSKALGYQSTDFFTDSGQEFKAILYTGVANPGHGGSSSVSVRAGGLDIHNHVASYLNFFIFMSFGFFWRQKDPVRKAFLAGCVLLMVLAQLMTYSRGGLLGLVGGSFVFMVLQPEFRQNFIKYSSYAFLGIIGLFLLIYGRNLDMAIHRITAIFGDTGVSGTSSRMSIWRDGFSLLKESPWLGAGIGGLRTTFSHPHAHNTYFSVLFDLGIAGFMLLGWLICRLVRIIHKLMKAITHKPDMMMARGFIAALVAYSIHAMVDFDFTWVQFFWGFSGIGLAMLRIFGETETGN
jgi:O-antigen ligase